MGFHSHYHVILLYIVCFTTNQKNVIMSTSLFIRISPLICYKYITCFILHVWHTTGLYTEHAILSINLYNTVLHPNFFTIISSTTNIDNQLCMKRLWFYYHKESISHKIHKNSFLENYQLYGIHLLTIMMSEVTMVTHVNIAIVMVKG